MRSLQKDFASRKKKPCNRRLEDGRLRKNGMERKIRFETPQKQRSKCKSAM